MKVVQLTTTIAGGAGIAALRVNDCLNNANIDSTLFFSDRHVRVGPDSTVNWKKNMIEQALSSMNTLFQRSIQRTLQVPISVYSTSMPRRTRRELVAFDIIHIHNYFNFLSLRDLKFLARTKKPIFITLHDERHFTAACHLTLGCKQFASGCRSCPQVVKPMTIPVRISGKARERVLRKFENLNVIAPSHWIKQNAVQSSLIKAREYRVIPNPVPQKFFQEANSKDITLEKESDLEINFTTIGFIAADVSNPMKNLSVVLEAINLLQSKESAKKYKLLLVGKNSLGIQLPRNVELVHSQSASTTIECLKRMDLLVVASLSENLPNVIAEALAINLRVVGSNRGGIPEMLNSNSGMVFDPQSPRALADAIICLMQSENDDDISKQACQKYGEEVVSKQLIQFYEQALRVTVSSNTSGSNSE